MASENDAGVGVKETRKKGESYRREAEYQKRGAADYNKNTSLIRKAAQKGDYEGYSAVTRGHDDKFKSVGDRVKHNNAQAAWHEKSSKEYEKRADAAAPKRKWGQ